MNDLVFHSGMGFVPESPYFFHVVRDEPLENLLGGGGWRGRAKYKKICSRKGKLNEEEIHTRQLTLKNIHTMA